MADLLTAEFWSKYGPLLLGGAIGAGGLGDLAIRYGYQRRYPPMLLVTVIFLIILVQLIQSVFSHVSARIDKRLDSGHKKGFAPLEMLARFTHTK